MDLTITLEEAKAQLADKQARVLQIRGKLAEMKTLSMGAATTYARDEAALAEAVLAGADIGKALESVPRDEQMTPAPVSPSGARRIVSGLEHVLAGALDGQNQAASAVRRAAMAELKALLAEEKAAYDAAAHELMRRWARVTELMSRVASATGMQQYTGVWASMRLPRAIPPAHVPAFTSGEIWCNGADEILRGGIGNRARAEVAELLKQKGID